MPFSCSPGVGVRRILVPFVFGLRSAWTRYLSASHDRGMMSTFSLGAGGENVDIIPRSWEADKYLVHADRNPNTNGTKILLTPTPGEQLKGIRERVQSGQI